MIVILFDGFYCPFLTGCICMPQNFSETQNHLFCWDLHHWTSLGRWFIRAKYFWSAIITKHWMIPNKTLASEMQIDSEKHLSVIHLVIQMPFQIGKAAISTNLFHQQELRLHKCLQKHLLELVTQGPKGGSKVVIKCECIFQKSN